MRALKWVGIVAVAITVGVFARPYWGQALQWVDDHGGATQALTSLALVFATIALVHITGKYTEATWRAAKAAEEQAEETKKAKELEYLKHRPYPVVVNVSNVNDRVDVQIRHLTESAAINLRTTAVFKKGSGPIEVARGVTPVSYRLEQDPISKKHFDHIIGIRVQHDDDLLECAKNEIEWNRNGGEWVVQFTFESILNKTYTSVSTRFVDDNGQKSEEHESFEGSQPDIRELLTHVAQKYGRSHRSPDHNL